MGTRAVREIEDLQVHRPALEDIYLGLTEPPG